MKNKLNVLLIICYCLSYFNSFSQTYLGVSFGRDYAKMEKNRLAGGGLGFDVHDKGFSIKSFSYGLELEQQISDRISVSLESVFTKKSVNASGENWIAEKGFEFNHYRHSLFVNTTIADHWILGGGGTYGVLKNLKQTYFSPTIQPIDRPDKNEIGAIAYIGYRYKWFSTKLTYHKGVRLLFSEGQIFKPIDFINFSLTYRIKILDRINLGGRNVGCPAVD